MENGRKKQWGKGEIISLGELKEALSLSPEAQSEYGGLYDRLLPLIMPASFSWYEEQ